jgi:hypothetical protein
VVASAVTFTVWAASFASYWLHVVHRKKGEGLLWSAGEFVKGVASARNLGKGGEGASEPRQAGELIGTSLLIWAMPWYAIRTSVAAFLGFQELAPAAFTKLLISITCSLEGIDDILSGMETIIAERILKRGVAKREPGPDEPEKPLMPPAKEKEDDEKLAA